MTTATQAPINDALPSLPAEQALKAQHEVLDLVARGASIHESLTAIARYAERTIPTMLASVLIFDPVAGNLRKGGYGRLPAGFSEAIDGMVPGPMMGSCGTAAFRRERVISHDVMDDPLWGQFRDFAVGYGVRSAWSSPIMDRHGELLGVFGMYYGDRRAPTEADLAVVDHLVHLAAIAIERHRFDAERTHQAMHDSLTGLANRRGLDAALARWTAMAAPPTLSVSMLDLDHFHLHNENFGHRTSDRLLAAAAARIAVAAAPGDLVVRFEGDRFLIVSEERGGRAIKVLERTAAAFEAPIEVGDVRVTLTVSSGLVEWDPARTDFEDALYQAIQAAQGAKKRGRGRWVAFGDAERKASQERRRLGRVVADAVAEHRVVPHMQPVISLAGGQTVGFEFLARLSGTGLDSVGPGTFIPIAEESSLIDALGMSIFRATCRALAEHAGTLGGTVASMNVSLRQLMREGFAAELAAAATALGAAPSSLCLEVTETQSLEGDSPARDTLLELKAAGFRLALDDFGTGYASLRQLQIIPFDIVKIDRSFVQRLGDGGRGTALCEAAIRMADACGMHVTAEGIETHEQAEALRMMGCRSGQGYLWARPMPVDDAVQWLRGRG
jgi:diguanylate cyclase (GGDEF)-like protein